MISVGPVWVSMKVNVLVVAIIMIYFGLKRVRWWHVFNGLRIQSVIWSEF